MLAWALLTTARLRRWLHRLWLFSYAGAPHGLRVLCPWTSSSRRQQNSKDYSLPLGYYWVRCAPRRRSRYRSRYRSRSGRSGRSSHSSQRARIR